MSKGSNWNSKTNITWSHEMLLALTNQDTFFHFRHQMPKAKRKAEST